MTPMKIVKRKANLIPFRVLKNQYEFYLSHRSKSAKQYPNKWSFWGGGIEENETPEKAMIREIREELNWKPDNYKLLGTYYDSMPNEKIIFFSEVGDDFEEKIEIRESQGGKFFTNEEVENEEEIIPEDKKVITDLCNYLEITNLQQSKPFPSQ